MSIKPDYTKLSLRDFEKMPGDFRERAHATCGYLDFLAAENMLNYLIPSMSGCGPVVQLPDHGHIRKGEYISFVSNDYLGLTQHPLVKKAAIEAIQKYGSGSGASPLIGGYYEYHHLVEESVARFFGKPSGSAIIYTTGYTANSATLMCLLKENDVAIVDMAVHSSVYEGIKTTNTKLFLHNDLSSLESRLISTKDKYDTRLVVVDGVYSQDGDIAPLKEILQLCRQHGALLMVDDAHGVGVVGKRGRGALELFDLLDQVDIISGTFSKTFGYVGGYVVADKDIIRMLKFQSRQYAFSAAAPPSILAVNKAIELIDQEPQWQAKLWENVNYFKSGLESLGLRTGSTQSAIIPVKIGQSAIALQLGKLLLDNLIYANPITYPAVSLKNSRIRMSVSAIHTRQLLDYTLNIFEHAIKKLKLLVN